MKNTWIVAANRVQARIFSQRPFALIKTFINPLGREKNTALSTDKPGMSRSRYSKSLAIHAMTGEKNPHEEAAIHFARKLCRYLEQERHTHHFGGLVIAAEPKMLGRIRGQMTKPLLSEVQQWLHEDFGNLTDHEIGKALGLTQRPHSSKTKQ